MPSEGFPAASLGRSPRPSRQGSHESLAHPLLSPPPTTTSTPHPHPVPAPPADPNTHPHAQLAHKYVPYTPRHRVPTTSATASVTGTSVASQPQPGRSATSKLQLQNLRGHVEDLGIDPRSIGWAILEKLVGEGDQAPEWNEIWNAITFGKATLLLPLEEVAPQQVITAEFVRDHVAVMHMGALQPQSPVLTLSGLRGSITENSLVLRSSLPQSSKAFQALLSPSTRTSALNALAPLPSTLPTSPYPQYSLPTHSTALPLPPRASGLTKPILPPRPGSTNSTAPAPSRLHGLTSLFGRSPSPAPVASPLSTSSPQAQSIATSSNSPDSDQAAGTPFEVAAYAIDRPILRKDAAKAIAKTIKAELKSTLAAAAPHAPAWVAERVYKFVSGRSGLHPFLKESRKGAGIGAVAGKGAQARARGGVAGSTSGNVGAGGAGGVVDAMLREPEDLSQTIQDFYGSLEEDLRASHSPITGKRREERERSTDDSDEKGMGSSLVEEKRSEATRRGSADNSATRVRETLDAVEKVLSTVFYDRLYRPILSDDVNHDEALSSRVAALNMLDLSLEHLGVDVGLAGPGVQQVVAQCGKTLSKLETCRSPAEKAAILVTTHKELVDGLACLPAIHLKPDSEIDSQKTPLAPTFPSSVTPSTAGGSHPPLTMPGSTPLSAIDASADSSDADRSSSTAVSTIASGTVADVAALQPASAPTSGVDGVNSPAPTAPVTPPTEAESSNIASARTPSPPPTRPHTPTPVSADVILPLLIFAVVKSNPPQLVSHLLFTRRFRDASVGGEESYCLITLMAVVEFLENVDLKALGLEDGESKVMSTADLSPIAIVVDTDSAEAQGIPARLRGRMEQQVDALTDSATRVLSGVTMGVTGVVDTSFGVLRSILPSTSAAAAHANQNGSNSTLATPSVDSEAGAAPWNTLRPGFGLLRRESGFSIASIAASLPSVSGVAGGGWKGPSSVGKVEEGGQQMMEVSSRPGSIRSFRREEDDGEDESSEEESSEDDEGDEDDEVGDGEEVAEVEEVYETHDTRSIRSFESMMSTREKERKGRKSLSDRLATVSGLARSQGKMPATSTTRTTSLPALQPLGRFDTPGSSRASSPSPQISLSRIPPPSGRFLHCKPEDLRLSEVGDLLTEYRRLVDAIRVQGGFDEPV